MRMIFEILIGPPMSIPASVHQYGFSTKIETIEAIRPDRHDIGIDAHDNAIDLSKRIEIELGYVDSIFISVKRTVYVSAGVRDHLDSADLKLGPRLVLRS